MSTSIKELYQRYLECSGVCTDTRRIEQECLFISLKGPNFNGNEFAKEALRKGAKYAIVDESPYAQDPNIFLVVDGLSSLQELARYHRKHLKIPIIGITGSNGKTTTKELISQVLSTTYKTYYTQGNLNNHIGVPLTILSITGAVQIAVIEMGANHIGEIANLCSMAQPTHGLITNIGRAHIEGFGGLEGVIRGKSELYQYLIDTNGIVFINSRDKILYNMSKRFKDPIFYPAEGDFLNITNCGAEPYLKFKGEGGQEVSTGLIGSYNFSNVAAALCVGKFFEVPSKLAETAVSEYVPSNNRSQVIKKGTNVIILDAYNANPSSMMVALENLISMEAYRKVAILGDMMELGEESASAHCEIVEMTRNTLSQVYLVGTNMGHAQGENASAQHFKDAAALAEYLKLHPPEQSTILIKASRSMGLEQLVDAL